MNDTPPDLDETLAEVWDILAKGVTHGDAPARLPVLATVDATGTPRLRTVALRAAHKSTAILEIHTDILSSKIRELRDNPHVSLLIWHSDILVQLRLSGTAQINTTGIAAQRWMDVPVASRVSYGHLPPPGTKIAASDAYECNPSPDRFAVLVIQLTHIESVSLDPAGHRRAEFIPDDAWQGHWVSP